MAKLKKHLIVIIIMFLPFLMNAQEENCYKKYNVKFVPEGINPCAPRPDNYSANLQPFLDCLCQSQKS